MLGGILLDRLALSFQPSAPPLQHTGVSTMASDGAADATSSKPVARPRAAVRRLSAQTATAPTVAVEDDVEDEVQAFRAKQSAELLALIHQRLRIAQKSISGRSTEGAVAQLMLYQTGLLDGIMRTAPELTGALSSQIERVLCEPKANPATQVSMLRMVSQMPDLGSARGMECILQSGHPEDEVLWAGLDALRATQLPEAAALDALASSAKDERTKQRLATLRNGAGQRAGENGLEHASGARSVSEELSTRGAPLDEEKEEP